MKRKLMAMLLAGILALQSMSSVLAEDMAAESVNVLQPTVEAASEMQTESQTAEAAAETQSEPQTAMPEEETAGVFEEQTMPEMETAAAEPQTETAEQMIQNSEEAALPETESEQQPEIIFGELEEEIILGEPVLETDALDAMPISAIPIYTSDLIGSWEGIYGTASYEIRLSVDSCEEDGNMSGTALINAGEKGACSFYGSVDFQTGSVLLTGDEWFSNPDGLEFKTFTGTLDAANHVMNGAVGENADAAFSVQKISENTMSAYMLAQSAAELPDYDIWMANTMIYGYDHNGNGLYQTFQSLADPVYKELGGYLLGDTPLMYMSSAWSVFLNSEYRNQFANEQKYIYEVLLMAYLKYDSKSQSASSVLDNDLMKNAMKLYSMLTNDIIENRSEYVNGMTVEDAVKFYENTDILKKMNIAMSELKAGVSSVKGLINTLSEYMTLQQAKEERVALLRMARNACDSSSYRNDDFISAADELINMVEGSPLIYVQNKSADYLWGEMCDYAWGKLCDVNPVLKTIEMGVEGLDHCFDSSNAASNNLKLAVLYTVDDYLKLGMMKAASYFMSNGSSGNGSEFLACFQGYAQFQMYGNDFAKTWLNGYLDSGAISDFVNMIFYRDNLKTAQELINHSEIQAANRKKLLQLMDRYSQIYKNLYMTSDMEETLYDDNVPVTGVNFSQSAYFLQNKNDMFLAYANIQPANATNKNITYTCSNPSIMSVPERGGFVTIYGSGTVTITAKTEDGGYTATQTVTIGDSATRKNIASGKCGSNARWELLDSGVLYILGSGKMYEYDRSTNPWHKYSERITKAIVNDGIENIGSYAFADCSKMTSIELPSSLKCIEDYAFQACSSLKSIEIPFGVTSIKICAFSLCKSLTSIKLPSSLTSVEHYAFVDCSGLVSVEFSSGITNLEEYTFFQCSNLKSVKLPSNLRSIGEGAFAECSSLASIELPASLTSIKRYAFSGCKNLMSIEIPSGVTSMDDIVFSYVGPDRIFRFTIIGEKGSYAEKYAAEHAKDGIVFKVKCNHKYKTVITEQPTCIKTGKSVEKCSECGEIKTGSEKVISKTAHRYDAYKITKQPTYTTEGLAVRSCTVCGYQEKKTLAKLPQNTAVKFSKDSLTLQVGKSVSLKSYVTSMQTGDSISRWKSFAPNIASVDTNGTVKALKAGQAYIAVGTKAGAIAKMLITVQDTTVHTTGISGLHTGIALEAGKTVALRPVLTPSNSRDPIVYKSVAPNIATVTANGVIKGIRSGYANIYVKSGTVYKKILVKVTAPTLRAITGVRKTGSLYVGASYQLRPQRYPAGSAGVFYYKSSNSAVAAVDKNGKITAKKKGTAVITVTARNVSTTLKLTVK